MRKGLLIPLALVALSALMISPWLASGASWSGVDEVVVEKFAREAGRPPRGPFIPVEEGDLLLFLFLSAGAAGGFVAGYYFRQLFPPRTGRP